MEEKGRKIISNIVLGLLFLMAFFFAVSISSTTGNVIDFWTSLGSQVLFLVISFLIYKFGDFEVLGINPKNVGINLMGGLLIGGIYLLLLQFIPGLSIATILLPTSISSGMKFFVVVVVSPIVESIFFLGALLGYIRQFNPTKKRVLLAIFLQAVFFALFHLGAYILNIYNYPAGQAFAGFSANFSVFFSAWIFAMLTGYLVYLKSFRSLLVAIVIHAMINFLAYTKFSILFGAIMSLL